MTSSDTVAVRKHPRVWWSRFKTCWPFLIWVLALGGGVFLYFHGGRFGGMAGVAEADRQDLAPLETARLRVLHVQVGQMVRRGELLAEMDPTVLDAEAELERLQAERQFDLAVNNAQDTLRDLQLRQAEGEGELSALREELERLEPLLAKQLVDARTVARLRARKGALEKADALYPDLIASAEQELAHAQTRRAALTSALDGTGAAAALRDSRLGLLALRRQSYQLYAMGDGVVSRVYHNVGEVVQGGAPVVTLVGPAVRRIMGFLPEVYTRDIVVGMEAYVSSGTGLGPMIPARVIAITPDIAALPNRISPVPGQTQRGQYVMLEPLKPAPFFPGEAVLVNFDRPLFSLLKAWCLNRFVDPVPSGAP